MQKENVLCKIKEEKLIVIFRGIPLEKVKSTAIALANAGVEFIEITFNHKSEQPERDFKNQFEAVKEAVGDRVCMGAGTVLNVEQARIAYELGAEYIVSPNTDERVIRYTGEKEMVSIPGAMTPSEIVKAWDCGADIVKLYIVDDPTYVKYLMGPLGHIPMLATCGVDEESIPKYLKAGITSFGTRVFITNDLLEQNNYKEIEKRASSILNVIKNS